MVRCLLRSLSARLSLACALVLAVMGARSASAQTLVRRITAGPVSGLELSIEGPTRAVRGGRVLWQLAVYEVTGLSTLRPAPGARVRVLSSLSRERAMAEATADALGRAQLGFEVPEHAPSSFHVVFEAISRSHVRRQFDLDVQVSPGRQLALFTDRARVAPGGVVHAWTQLSSTSTGRPIAGAAVTLTLVDARRRPVGARVDARTDERGLVAHSFTLPRGAGGEYTVRARHQSEHDTTEASRAVSAALETTPALVVRAAPEQSLTEPNRPVRILVSVRTADGRPVADAIVRSPRMPRAPRETEEPSVRTDRRGVASFQFVAPELPAGSAPVDLATTVHVSRVGLGEASAQTSVRVARAGLFGAAAIEGRALVEGLPGRIYARVVRADGSPVGAGVAVHLSGARFGRGARAVTDANGVATLDVEVGPAPAPRRRAPTRAQGAEASEEPEDETQDPCGGSTATGFQLAFEEGAIRGVLHACAPIEPDGTLRVRVREGALVQPGAELHVTLARAPSVARLAVHVALLASDGSAMFPVAAAIAAAGANEVALRVPDGARGLLQVRARPLFGALAVPILGGSTAVWSHVGQRPSLSMVRTDDARLVLDGAQGEGLAALVSIVPREQSEHLVSLLQSADNARALGDLRTDFSRAGDALIAGAVASLVRRDESAPALLRGGRLVDLPAPEEPSTWGTLRDPFRASARFVEGRLALIFSRIESHVASMVRSRRADVAQRDGGRWEFNREIFDAILRSNDGDSSGGARNLGGAPLSIDDLRRLDPSFTFDNVARRITRKRMFALLVALRQFVSRRSLDLRWSWRGDPTAWLRQMARDGDFSIEDSEGNSTTISADDMVDGWGNRFALRPSPGGRSRFTFLSPVPGFDLVSAGPDERVGTADDVVDPFARVLPSGGAYARAVDEDGLVARLRGVELGRATIARLATVFEDGFEGDYNDEGSSERGSGAGPNWHALPSRLHADPFALSLVRPASEARSILRPSVPLRATTEVAVEVDDEPRTWTAIAQVMGVDGSTTFATRTFTAGTPVLATLPFGASSNELRSPTPRVRVGEPVELVAAVSNIDDRARQYTVLVSGEGSIRASAPRSIDVGAGLSEELPITIEAVRPGLGALRLELRDPAGSLLRALRVPLLADLGGLALRTDVMTAGRSVLALRGEAPADARGVVARLLLSTPAGLADDPELDRVRRTDPALIAWAYTLSGRALPASLQDALLAAQSASGEVLGEVEGRSPLASPLLSTAAALVAWASADEDDEHARRALSLARSRLPALVQPLPDADSVAGRIRAESATLAALASGVAGLADGEGSDTIAAFVARTRESLRAVYRTHVAQPTVLARAAAALLLADPTDARARQMYDRAKEYVVDEGPRGALVAAGEGRVRLEEALAASAAMAIAAQQRGELALSEKLARGVAVRGHLAMRAGGEAAFWLLADAAYAVFGLANPSRVRATVNGRTRELALRDGRAEWALGSANAVQAELQALDEGAASASLFARWECLFEQRAQPRSEGPVSLSVQGDIGYAGERAALELTVTGTSESATPRVVIELQLPAGAWVDSIALSRLRAMASSVELREGGLLRFVLASITKDQVLTLPLPLRWTLRGTVSGLGAVAYAEGRPTRMTVLPGRELSLRPRPSTAVDPGSTSER